MKRAFTLTEILIVVVIVALIAGLLLPVLLRAKSKSKEVPCTSNLRQLYTSLALYMQDHDDRLPDFIGEFASNGSGANSVLRCPSDTGPGANRWVSERMKQPVSYFYIESLPEFREAIFRADPNHGVLYCVLHGERLPESEAIDPRLDTTGLVLRLRRDGSVQHAHVGHMCGPKTPMGRNEGRQPWSLLTDVPCKTDLECQGLTEPCGP